MKEGSTPISWNGVLVVVITLAVVLLLFRLGLENASPGGLSRPHANTASLNAANACSDCHGEGDLGMADSCGACHELVLENITAGIGFHGRLESELQRECKLCHLDHNGASFALVSDASFRLAGIEDRETYDHGGTAFALAQHDASLACVECHQNADEIHLNEGQQRFLGQAANCVSCHEDYHEGQFGMDCAECHGQASPFPEVSAFEHESFEALGAHQGLGCVECHRVDGEFELSKWFEEDAHFDQRDCADCHEDPHTPQFLGAVAELRGVSSAASCALCHGASLPSFDGDWESMSRDLHPSTGVELVDAHAALDCAACHVGDSFEERFPGREAQACSACHEDPHGGQFAPLGDAAPKSRCSDCHSQVAFSPSTFDVEAHDRSAFALQGSHRAVACGECHVAQGPTLPPVFAGTKQLCVECHGDVHRGVINEQDCSKCHGALRFDEVLEGSFVHGVATGFELRGVHKDSACESCHLALDSRDELGRSFQFASAVFGGPATQCATCHEDVHGGSFDSEQKPSTYRGAEGCARCHTEESFSIAMTEEFDHALWTSHALEGAHMALECKACHKPRAAADELGRKFGLVSETFGVDEGGCVRCHSDPHLGTFDQIGLPMIVKGRSGCARCHNEASFQLDTPSSFEHSLWTSFKLDGDHAALDCAECHNGSVYGVEGSRGLGRVAGTRCADCHGDPHVGQFAEQGATDCARCHAPQGGLDFDHQRDTRFDLDERHSALDCAACHIPWPLSDGRMVVRYKPLGTVCADCHGEGFEGQER